MTDILDALRAIVGPKNVLTGDDMAAFNKDWTGRFQGAPIAVLRPGTTAEVSDILKLAHANDIPVTPLSGNTGLVGGGTVEGGFVVSTARMNNIREIRPGARIAKVDAGVVLSNLHDAADDHDLVFPLTFGARGSAMIGGVLSTNAGGSNVVRYGSTRGLCLGLEVVLANGDILNLMSELHKDNSGYDLKDMFVGAEGTLGLITGAVLKLFPKPQAYATAMVAVPTLDDALSLLNHLQKETGGAVEAFEYMPAAYMTRHQAHFPKARAPFDQTYDVNILVEVGATAPRDTVADTTGAVPIVTLMQDTLAGLMNDGTVLDAVVATSDAQRSEMWARRESAAEITFDGTPIVDNDVAVAVDHVPGFLAAMTKRLQQVDPGASELAIAHLGDGNIHYSAYPTTADKALADNIKMAVEDEVAKLSGSFSAEHGVGVTKLASMRRHKQPVALAVMGQIKAALDPKGIMNPGKVIPDQT